MKTYFHRALKNVFKSSNESYWQNKRVGTLDLLSIVFEMSFFNYWNKRFLIR